MKKLIAVLGVLVMLGTIAGCACHAPEQMSYKGENR
jgi:predicted small lipoprotein YifL